VRIQNRQEFIINAKENIPLWVYNMYKLGSNSIDVLLSEESSLSLLLNIQLYTCIVCDQSYGERKKVLCIRLKLRDLNTVQHSQSSGKEACVFFYESAKHVYRRH